MKCKTILEYVKLIHGQYGGAVRSANPAARLQEFEF